MNIVFANLFDKFILPRTSCEAEENDEPTANYRQLHETCRRDRKIFLRTWKRTKIQTKTVPTELRASFVFVKKVTGDGSQRIVHCEPQTNYTNIVFVNWLANEMFTSVYAALCFTEYITHCALSTASLTGNSAIHAISF